MRLVLNCLEKKYGKKSVLTSASYEFEEGKLYSILGRNGVGKTTLFNCISSDVPINGGEIFIEERGVLRKTNYDDIGIVSASPNLPDFLTGYEFISFFMRLNSDDKTKRQRIDELFELVRIEEADRHRLIKNYSYGMKNKIQLLCCILKNPKVILLDEPLSSFDVVVSHDIKELLIQMKENHIIIMATHIMQLAKDVSDEIVILHNGKLYEPDAEDLDDQEFKSIVKKELDF